jgi:hypothetical protein
VGEGSLDIDDDDAAVPAVAVLVLVVFLILARRAVALPALVADGDLQPRLFVPPALLFFAASNLFDDPGFEHDADL